jgi:hypothetical protein
MKEVKIVKMISNKIKAIKIIVTKYDILKN